MLGRENVLRSTRTIEDNQRRDNELINGAQKPKEDKLANSLGTLKLLAEYIP